MLSRGLSNASSRSSQPKSLTFIQTHPLAPLEYNGKDPETAHKQAIAAASFAYGRASERALATQGLKATDVGQPVNIEEELQKVQHLGRKQSIRFTGLTAVPILNRSITRRVAPDHNDMYSLHNGGQDRSHATGVYISGHGVSGARNPPPSKGDAYGSRIPSSSASYRKLRRARSMFSLRGSAPNMFSDNRQHKNFKDQQKSDGFANKYGQQPHVTDSRLRRSFSFLRGEKDHMASGFELQKNKTAAAQLAREQYLRELEEPNPKGESPSLAAGHHRKPQKAFRRSVRSSSTNSYDSATASSPTVPTAPASKKGLGYKARSLSFSLKQKLKQVFHRSSNLEESLPVQQLKASRPHFGKYTSTYPGVDQEYQQISSPDNETLHKARSRESSLGNVPPFPESVSPAKSICSVRSEDEGSPLFTSWAHPTPVNILTSTQSREKKRLSVIQEHGGPHQPSSSAHSCADLSDVFHTPTRNSSMDKQVEVYVDSQKMYSALQQKIYENRRLAQPEEYSWEKEKTAKDTEVKTSGPPRASLSSQPLTSVTVDSSFPDHGIKPSSFVMAESIKNDSMNDDVSLNQDRSEDYSDQGEFLDMYTRWTPQQIAEHNESNDIHPKRPLQEIKAALFPSSMRVERTNGSPYRRLMGSGGENEIGAGSEIEEHTAIRFRSESAFGSASVYSRTSGGNTPNENISSVSLTKSESSHERGTAVVIKPLPRPHQESLAPLTRQNKFLKKSEGRQDSIKCELPQLENLGLGKTQDFIKAGKENRHKREDAQLEDDDVEMKRLRGGAQMKKEALGTPLQKTISQPNLRNQTSQSSFTRSPLLQIGQPITLGESEQSLPSSPCHPIAPRRSLYLTHDMSSSSQRNQGSTLPWRTASNGTPKSQGGDYSVSRDGYILNHGLPITNETARMDSTPTMHRTPTPAPIRAVFRTNKVAKSQGYSSPERLARIRRLQSNSSLSSHNKCLAESNIGEYETGKDNQRLIDSTFRNPPTIEELPNKEVTGTAFEEIQSEGVGNMVDSFLNTRRGNIRMSQESSMGPAFL